MKLPWAKVEPGMRVEMKGRSWTVLLIETGKKRATVTLSAEGMPRFTGEVKLKDEVTIARAEEYLPPVVKKMRETLDRERPLRDANNGQARWATEVEASAVLEPGDPSLVKPPAKAKGSPWSTPADDIEQRVADLLGAHLVAESKDTAAGYYVPPQTVATIKAHLLIFHPGADLIPPEGDLLAWHGEQHRLAREGSLQLERNHWHTEKRPS